MQRPLQGRYILTSTAGEKVRAFVPSPLPPVPPIEWTPDLRGKFDAALVALGRLDSLSRFLPDASLLLYLSVRKEAVLSSMIEGTQSSLSDLLLFELNQETRVPVEDVRQVSNYVAALDYGLNRLAKGFPLSLRLIREIHSVLLSKGRGADKNPGEFRRSQNWIGGLRPGTAFFVPPPPDKVMECMGKLELFLHDQPEPSPPLLKAALFHVQFETIHPFLDGNGRLGRLLITLILCEQGILHRPLLYLSLYFKIHRQKYYTLLNTVRQSGDWEAWLEFFADAVFSVSSHTQATIQELVALVSEDSAKIRTLGRASSSALQVHRAMMEQPLATSGALVQKTGMTPATVNKALSHLEHLGIVTELTQQRRNRIFSYQGYIKIMEMGTELPH